ncbi:MAG TPA: adenylate/guanylate cyclase domain-containing protein [Microvirga sp.]|jgi:class 3 adenylate cyclase|nr:adenylate/guanylate cyclase domain-containing protein [Microvirga sp.]
MGAPAAAPRVADTERFVRAVRAQLRQEFAAPAASIVGYAEMLIEDAGRLGLDASRSDLDRVLAAGQALQRLIANILARDAGTDDEETFRKHLRHDLRTPINAIKGYGEMLLEDAEADGQAGLAQDLRRLLVAAEGMLARIDALVDFTHEGAVAADAADPAEPLTSLVSHAFESMRFERDASRPDPVGHILVVDDNEPNRDLLARRLARDGHSVELAADGYEALAAVAERPFDLVLLDLMMPGMSGYEVLGRLKADDRTREIPVIMISALDEMDTIVRCIEAGAIDYLPKPFDPTLLRARIGSSLDNKLLRDRERRILAELRVEKDRNDALLHSILPHAIVERIKAGGGLIADDVAEVTIIFADLVNFTQLAGSMEASALVRLLNEVFSAFDRLAQSHGAEKIKTIGDAYMVALGLPEARADHVEAAAGLALDLVEAMKTLASEKDVPLKLRVGLHCGPVVAGVIGEGKFAYDVWGNTVNIASRLESHGAPGRIHVSQAVQARLDGRFRFEDRGTIVLKGAGEARTYFLLG